MKKIKNLPVSLQAKLLAYAKANGDDYNRTLVRYGIERFLFRLSQHPDRDRFVLKGAMLFITWPEGAQRPTGDLDVLAYGPPEVASMSTFIKNICSIPGLESEDGLMFALDKIVVEAVREDAGYQGLRVEVPMTLGTTRINLQIDVGFGDAVYPPPKRISFPCLLPADMPAPQVLAYPPETVIAEKFEAMVRFGEADSRLKDFNDIWAIMKTFNFEMATLVEAVLGTFNRRGTVLPNSVPFALTAEFGQLPEKRRMWNAFLGRNPPAMPPPPLDDLLTELRGFFGPMLAAAARSDNARGQWDPIRGWVV
ncbi:MAG: nucleotidyl transferase AbiEii/AbiGii toxin family protein [Alphaproteobacteria bacterium]